MNLFAAGISAILPLRKTIMHKIYKMYSHIVKRYYYCTILLLLLLLFGISALQRLWNHIEMIEIDIYTVQQFTMEMVFVVYELRSINILLFQQTQNSNSIFFFFNYNISLRMFCQKFSHAILGQTEFIKIMYTFSPEL